MLTLIFNPIISFLILKILIQTSFDFDFDF
ncbi:hypothetical protein R80B4_01543 [Fibrobacteres bacterium R8-0-B4]